MATLIEDVARLKELECASRQLLCDRQEYAEKMASTAPALLEVLGAFQDGDANEIAYAIDVLLASPEYTGDPRVLRRLEAAATKMEAKRE